METPVKGEISASEARKISERHMGFALTSELSKVYAQIGQAAENNATALSWSEKLSPQAQKVLVDLGYKVEDRSYDDPREQSYCHAFRISW